MYDNIIMPFYKVFMNGKEIDANMYPNINKINVVETHHGANKCSIYVNDPDFVFIEGSMIVESTPVKIDYGFMDKTGLAHTKTFEGYVSVIDGDFPENGMTAVVIHCMDKSHIMNRKEKTRTWQNRKVSDVVTEIFRSYGFKVQVEDTGKVLESIEQKDQTDIAFITSLVDKVEGEEFISYIEGETAYFVKRRTSGEAKNTITYRQADFGLLSFTPRINKESKKIKRVNYDINLQTLQVEPISVNPKYKQLGGQQVKISSSRR